MKKNVEMLHVLTFLELDCIKTYLRVCVKSNKHRWVFKTCIFILVIIINTQHFILFQRGFLIHCTFYEEVTCLPAVSLWRSVETGSATRAVDVLSAEASRTNSANWRSWAWPILTVMVGVCNSEMAKKFQVIREYK